VNEIIEMTQRDGATEEMALAFILAKYNTGIAILKQDASGNFKRLNTTQSGTTPYGNNIYIATNCI